MNAGVIVSLSIYMIGMLVIGYFAYRRTQDLSDYMLGGRNLGPAVTALSAGASDMSGWLLMGLPGAMYAAGLSSGWIVVGLTLGAYLNWLYVAPRLRTYTEIANNSITIPDYFENRFQDSSRVLRIVSALVIFIFFTFYTSSGMVSGGELFKTAFGMDYAWGVWLTASVVILYTLFGGFLAVSWTDFVQGTIMFIALILVPLVTLFEIGGWGTTVSEIKSIDPALLDAFRGTSVIGILSFLAWGLGYFGQPHIIVRFMAITSVKEMKSARRIGMGWMIFSIVGAMFTGLLGIAYFHQSAQNLANPETVFIVLSDVLFHPLIFGFMLAAILAAVMSTISSQLLVTASALTEDFYKAFMRRSASDKELVLVGRISLLIVALIALYLALNPNETILNLVGYAWAGFGSAFGPVVLLSLYWKRMNKWGALAGMITGAVTVIIWEQIEAFAEVYEMIPGFIACTIAIIVVSLLTAKPSAKVLEEFDQAVKQSG
ncbi:MULTISPECIES: sodium/proline symporter PutP [Thermoactinomyces]|jgi:sodium/proline symporter|uniref:sodium/proline symporter PutP n=1 Tax=Thermoactinomyces TaxID=2023 RepID=UPI0005047A61|nr:MULTISPECIES: sodium/proline symporter PutP [Thermoactinomyces]KFZ40018.1 proline:sodium symporter PutP [Thermoactinomyces sp. Gus2-1]MBH8586917.1 sodium/proline symporter PutP [Thermoactinomyces sp. CICC 10520]MBI0388060.1 sodium/proline symporter PutP [Thermoactinomyces sp. CICC 24227]MBI0392893.1 sodium/proline symporter PutP [Thermoactinomyces sp. CICC 24226]QCV56468.1 sodium/proline symporter PutP [Thermoactinomyces vulgaris]